MRGSNAANVEGTRYKYGDSHDDIELSRLRNEWRKLDTLSQQHPRHAPKGLLWKPNSGYSYDWILGVQATDARQFYYTAELCFWYRKYAPRLCDDDVLAYARYVQSKTSLHVLDLITENVSVEDLTPVKGTHGDMTYENVLLEPNGNVVFIDPGCDWGLRCREIDEAKILQSADGWKLDTSEPNRRSQRIGALPFTVRRVHWALLLTHYIRLLSHDHDAKWLDFARDRVSFIIWELSR